MINKIGKLSHHITGILCIAFFSVLLITEVLIVLFRYVFNTEFSSIDIVAMYSLSALVILAIPYALAREAHNRVDLLKAQQDATMSKTVDILAIALLLFPIIGLVLYLVIPNISYSWDIFASSEQSADISGLALIKTFLPVSGVLMMIQGLAVLSRDKTNDALATQ